MNRDEHIKNLFYGQPLMITERKLWEIEELVRLHAAGAARTWTGPAPDARENVELYLVDKERGALRIEAAEGDGVRHAGKVAVIPIVGVMSQRVSPLAEMSGATSTTRVQRQVQEQAADPDVRAVILEFDSPGGSVYGVQELADVVYNARSRKPIIAVANSFMASAAYYVGAQADELIVTPSGEVGSIGVLGIHVDESGKLEKEGVRPTILKAGKYKGEFSSAGPLSEEAAAHLQADIDRHYSMFVDAVARGRGVKPAAVRDGFGQGRMVGAPEAVELNMADRIATLQETIQRFGSGGRVRRRDGKAAEEEDQELVARTRTQAIVTEMDLTRRRRLADTPSR